VIMVVDIIITVVMVVVVALKAPYNH